jgi:DNA-binding MarR family transcriptional regulator
MSADPAPLTRKLPSLDRLIHEPARLMVIAILSTVESADFLYLQQELDLTKGNLSSHLAKLEEAGYIQVEKTYRGKKPLTICRLTAPGLQAFEAYRRQLKQFMENIPYAGDQV